MKVACVLEALDGFFKVVEQPYPPPVHIRVPAPIEIGGAYDITSSHMTKPVQNPYRLFALSRNLHDGAFLYKEIPC